MKVIATVTWALVALVSAAKPCEAFAPTGGNNHPTAPADTQNTASALERLNNRLGNIQQDIQSLKSSFVSPFAFRAQVDAQTRLGARISKLHKEAGQVRSSALSATRGAANSDVGGTSLARLIENVKASRSTISSMTPGDENKRVLPKTLSETMAIAEARAAEAAEKSARGVRMETATNPAGQPSPRTMRDLPMSISERIRSRPY